MSLVTIPTAIPLVLFPNLTTTTPQQKAYSWEELAGRLTAHEERRVKDGRLWSPAVYRDGMTRSNAAVESVTALVFDVDHAEPDWSLLEGYEYVAHTTFRYTADDPRWRIVLPLTRPVPAADWAEIGARARAALCPLADTSCKDAARAFYTPACQPGAAHFTRHGSGVAVDSTALPPVPPEPTPDVPHAPLAGPTGGRPGDDYAARGSWSELLTAHGWVHESTIGEEQRWRRPDKRKGAGISATIGHKGHDILYVFSSSAPPFEAGKGYSKFTVYALLEHAGDFHAAATALAALGYGEQEHILPIDLGRTVDPVTGEITGRDWRPGVEIGPSGDRETEAQWPEPLAREALYGLAGDVAALFSPHTEADPTAILVQFLIAFSNAAGPTPHVMVGPTRHGARLSAVIVGNTSRARKGDSWQCVREVFRYAESDWLSRCVSTGLSTGEGLINVVRDGMIDVSQPGRVVGGEIDRRVLAVETEFGRTLKAMARDGNTLSAVLRDAWDGRDLAVMTRGTPLRATGAHIGVIGHVTVPELRRELSATDAHNGFANRFLWACVKRSQYLPDPLPVPQDRLAHIAARVTVALDTARKLNTLVRDDDTRALWHALYPALTHDHEGLAGDVLARSEAQVLRLSMVYALLDGSNLIQPCHLAAAVALWDYCAASVFHIFGSASGDAVADDILRFLARGGEHSRTDISALLGRHIKSERIGLALASLEKAGRVTFQTQETAGRPTELWRATGTAAPSREALLPNLNSHISLFSQAQDHPERSSDGH